MWTSASSGCGVGGGRVVARRQTLPVGSLVLVSRRRAGVAHTFITFHADSSHTERQGWLQFDRPESDLGERKRDESHRHGSSGAHVRARNRRTSGDRERGVAAYRVDGAVRMISPSRRSGRPCHPPRGSPGSRKRARGAGDRGHRARDRDHSLDDVAGGGADLRNEPRHDDGTVPRIADEAPAPSDTTIRQVRQDAATMIGLHVFAVLEPQITDIVGAESITRPLSSSSTRRCRSARRSPPRRPPASPSPAPRPVSRSSTTTWCAEEARRPARRDPVHARWTHPRWRDHPSRHRFGGRGVRYRARHRPGQGGGAGDRSIARNCAKVATADR